MSRIIVFTGGKGGVGKTTCCAFVGFNLAKLGARTVMLDIDIGLNNLDVTVGIDRLINYDIVDVVYGKCRLSQALIRMPDLPLLYVLPSAHTLNVGKVQAEDLRRIVADLSTSFEYILIDCPAGIGSEFYRAVYLSSEAIIVTTPTITAIRDADKTAELICGCGVNTIGLIVNRVRTDLIAKRLMVSPEDIARSLDLEFLGAVPESDEITALSSISGRLFEAKGSSSEAYSNIARAIYYGTKKATEKDKIFDFLKRRKKSV